VSGSGSGSAPRRAFADARALLTNPIVYGYGGCYFFLKLIRYSLLFWLPFYLHAQAGFDEITSGYLSTAFEIGGVAGTIAIGLASDRSRRPRAFGAALSIAGLCAALLVYARLGTAGALAHAAALALIGALLFGPDALVSGAAAQDAGGVQSAATAVGIVSAMGGCGALLQGALTVGVQRAFGWNALFYVFIALAGLALSCLVPGLRASGSSARAAIAPGLK
jgi:sugar phosphate permease